MKCPKCKYKKSKVFDVRKYFTFILRSRRCYRCRHEWKTQEMTVSMEEFQKLSYSPDLNKNKNSINHNLFESEDTH